jgi:AraC family transcriptional regulator
MLRYLGAGPRQFGLFPLKARARMNWEFFAVVKGRCAPLGGNNAPARLAARTLWITAPGSAHTWAGEGPRTAEVAVFHFGSVPAALEAAVRDHGQIAVALTAAACRRLAALARELQPEYHQPTPLSPLVFEAALLELSVLVLRQLPSAKPNPREDHAERIVAHALAWYGEHLRSRPSITDVAREVHVSASTLRRMFQRVRREKPTRAFGRMQVERGMRLMAETKVKLDAVAEECGFTSTSDFCRAFKAFQRVSPAVWRATVLTAPRAARGGEDPGKGGAGLPHRRSNDQPRPPAAPPDP